MQCRGPGVQAGMLLQSCGPLVHAYVLMQSRGPCVKVCMYAHAEQMSMRPCMLTWISMSTACPLAPPRGWWIMMRELGMLYLLPFLPAPKRNAPIEAARPKQYVDTSDRHRLMASYMPSPAVTDPPANMVRMASGGGAAAGVIADLPG
jgi:hypothetical protein